MFSLVNNLPEWVENHIVCERTLNLEQFRLPNIHNLYDASPWQYYWDKGLRKLHVRNHLGFLVKISKMQRADMLHSHFGNIGWANIEAAKKSGVKHLVSFYGKDVTMLPATDPIWHGRYGELFKQVDCVLCLGKRMRQRVLDMGCPETKIRVNHLGIDANRISFKPRKWNSTEPLRVLMVASFMEKKGIPYALEALGRLQNEVQLEITIIGDANREKRSQNEKKKILDTIRKNNLTPKVRMLGYQPQSVMFEEAYRHHIFVSPSVTAVDGDAEGTPVTIMEMAAMGMPVISTRHSDIPAIIQHGHSGLLAEERDVDGLVAHLQRLIEHPDRWLGMLLAARLHVEKEYDAKVQMEKLASIYREVVDGER